MEENNSNSAADLQNFSISIDQLGKSTFFFRTDRAWLFTPTKEGSQCCWPQRDEAMAAKAVWLEADTGRKQRRIASTGR